VETEHHLPVPAHPSPVYQLYKAYLPGSQLRCIHNTLTNRVIIWQRSYDDDNETPPKDRLIATEYTQEDCEDLIVPDHIWTTYKKHEYKILRDALLMQVQE
jgi:hypothetical protein